MLIKQSQLRGRHFLGISNHLEGVGNIRPSRSLIFRMYLVATIIIFMGREDMLTQLSNLFSRWWSCNWYSQGVSKKHTSLAPSKGSWVSHHSTYYLVYGSNLVSHQSLTLWTWCSNSVGLPLLSLSKEPILRGWNTYLGILYSFLWAVVLNLWSGYDTETLTGGQNIKYNFMYFKI